MPIMRSCVIWFMLSSFCFALLSGRIQLLETVKRDGGGSLKNMVMPKGSDAIHRPVRNLGQGG
jgi:hypothetical protein